MNAISNKLRLCSRAPELSSLTHYWVLHRSGSGNTELLTGELLLPREFGVSLRELNAMKICGMLNEEDVFEVDRVPVPQDRLLLSVLHTHAADAGRTRLDYCFSFQDGEWLAAAYIPLEWTCEKSDAASAALPHVAG